MNFVFTRELRCSFFVYLKLLVVTICEFLFLPLFILIARFVFIFTILGNCLSYPDRFAMHALHSLGQNPFLSSFLISEI